MDTSLELQLQPIRDFRCGLVAAVESADARCDLEPGASEATLDPNEAQKYYEMSIACSKACAWTQTLQLRQSTFQM